MKIGEIITEEEITNPNPDFLAYMYKKEMVHQNKSQNRSHQDQEQSNMNIIMGMGMGMGLQNIPPKTIIKKDIKQHVICAKDWIHCIYENQIIGAQQQY